MNLRGKKNSILSASSAGLYEVVPTEDAIQAFMDHLLPPSLLPSSFSNRGPAARPSLSERQSVAKQIHAVVLLYNYYHRKKYPDLELLNFEWFCKLAVITKPSLLTHLEFMQRCDTKSKNVDNQLSVTEKAIMEACKISVGLDASRDIPNMEGWAVSKVAVFLIDSTKKNCFLSFNSTTQKVWSLIEKKVNNSMKKSKIMSQIENTNPESLVTDEYSFRQLAFSAVKEITGIEEKDLTVLESHFVYSLCEEKTAARFYLMSCAKSVRQDIINAPVKDVIYSLKGSLVLKISNNCTVTQVVEYFHLLPYGEILSDWLSREMHPISSPTFQKENKNVNTLCSLRTNKQIVSEVDENGDTSSRSSQTADIMESQKSGIYLRENGCLESENECKATRNKVPVDHAKKNLKFFPENDSSISKSGCKDKVEEVGLIIEPDNNSPIRVTAAYGMDINDALSGQDGNHPPFKSIPQNYNELHAMFSSKGNHLFMAALRLIQKKRDDLSRQQRHIQDEIAQCDKNLQTILNGGEEGLILRIESILEACTDTRSIGTTQAHMGKRPHSEEQLVQQTIKKMKLSEAILSLQTPSQELDDICCANNWTLPRYNVLAAKGERFTADVAVEGIDFEYEVGGEERGDPCDARDSAAINMLRKLRSMASHV